MLYSSEASLAKFTADLTRFYASDVSGLSAIDERPAVPHSVDIPVVAGAS